MKFKKLITVSSISILVLSTIPIFPKNVLAQDIESQIESELQSDFEDSDVNIKGVKVTSSNIEVTSELGTGDEVKITLDSSDSNSDLATTNFVINDDEYSIFWGTTEQKNEYEKISKESDVYLEKLSQNIFLEDFDQENQNIISPEDTDLENLSSNEETNPTSTFLEYLKSDENIIDSEEKLNSSSIIVTDNQTGEETIVNANDSIASLAWFIPVGIVLSKGLVGYLINTGIAIILGGAVGLALSYVSTNSKTRNKNYAHYAVTKAKGKLIVVKGLNYKQAVSWLKSKQDTWSTSGKNAQSVAKGASPIQKAVGSEIDSNSRGKFYHYHPAAYKKAGKYVRAGGHAFFGGPR